MTTTLYILGGLASLYGLALLGYVGVLHWLDWNSTTQSHGYATTLAKAWQRCHGLMDKRGRKA